MVLLNENFDNGTLGALIPNGNVTVQNTIKVSGYAVLFAGNQASVVYQVSSSGKICAKARFYTDIMPADGEEVGIMRFENASGGIIANLAFANNGNIELYTTYPSGDWKDFAAGLLVNQFYDVEMDYDPATGVVEVFFGSTDTLALTSTGTGQVDVVSLGQVWSNMAIPANLYMDDAVIDNVHIGSGTTPPPQITINVAAGANGTVSPSGSQTLTVGQTYAFVATPNLGYSLDHWDLNGANLGSITPLSLTVTSAMNGQNLTAIFKQITTVGGTTNPVPGSHVYDSGATIQVNAIPNSGYVFDHWVLDNINVGATNPYTVTMNANHNLQAIFKAGVNYTLTVNSTPIQVTITVLEVT